jgi:hypothetical protein
MMKTAASVIRMKKTLQEREAEPGVRRCRSSRDTVGNFKAWSSFPIGRNPGNQHSILQR